MIIQNITLTNVGYINDVQSIVTANLVANYDPATGISGSTFNDSSGNGYNATFLNSSSTFSPTPVLVNGSYVLPLVSSSGQYYAYLNGYTNMQGTSVTFDAWFNTSSSATAQTIIAEFGQKGSSPTYFSGSWNDAVMGMTSTNIAAGAYNNAQSGYVTGSSYTANTWYNVVIVIAPGLYTLYINGVAYGTTATTRTNSTPSPVYYPVGLTDSAHTYLGGVQGDFNGYLGPVKFYSTALTQAQVTQNFTALRWRYGV